MLAGRNGNYTELVRRKYVLRILKITRFIALVPIFWPVLEISSDEIIII